MGPLRGPFAIQDHSYTLRCSYSCLAALTLNPAEKSAKVLEVGQKPTPRTPEIP
jgi:hypothetical protein